MQILPKYFPMSRSLALASNGSGLTTRTAVTFMSSPPASPATYNHDWCGCTRVHSLLLLISIYYYYLHGHLVRDCILLSGNNVIRISDMMRKAYFPTCLFIAVDIKDCWLHFFSCTNNKQKRGIAMLSFVCELDHNAAPK